MSKPPPVESAPTMIIPRGTEIQVDAHGQLSIRAPGNLVLQHSGSYGTLESVAGSIRVEREVEVEAVSVRCAQTCYVQGNLTAWQVTAQSLEIEETGRAYVVLQETDRLEIGREARLVGNFENEKELFLLFSRFADQVRSLPFFPKREADGKTLPPEAATPGAEAAPLLAELTEAEIDPPPAEAQPPEPPAEPARAEPPAATAPAPAPPPAAPATPPRASAELPEPLYLALVLLEREAQRKSYGPTSQRVLDELIKLLRERDFETLQHIHRTLFGRVVEPREDVRRARDLVEQAFGGQPGSRTAGS